MVNDGSKHIGIFTGLCNEKGFTLKWRVVYLFGRLLNFMYCIIPHQTSKNDTHL